MDFLLPLIAVCIAVVIILSVQKSKRKGRREGTAADLETARSLFKKGLKAHNIADELKKLNHLPHLEGYESVITLLKHHHRKRALERLQELSNEWNEEGLRLYRVRR